jgi:hypothetical protein
MARKPRPKTLVANQSFHLEQDGRTLIVKRGELVQSDDPVVKGREPLFEELRDEPAGTASGS